MCKQFFRSVQRMLSPVHFAHCWRLVLLRAMLAGHRSLSDFTAAKIPPAVRFIVPKHGTTVEADHLEVELVGMDDNEVSDVELFINGRPVAPAIQRNMQRERTLLEPVSEPHKVAWRFKLAVPLPPGEEVVRIGAIGYDDERLKSNLAEVSIFRRLTREEIAGIVGDLYVLCVGVGKYKDTRLNLTFADADAKDFADLFRTQKGLGYREVFVTVLTNEEATTSGVRAALFELVEKVKPTDTVILLFAGHGVRDERFNYYFCTHDSEARNISETGLPTRTFEALLRSLQAKEIFAFIDTCFSSEVLGEMRVGAERLAERLMKKAGVVVFCAGTGEEASVEKDEWGHSAFTLALLEGLKGEADKSPQDGLVTLEELQTFVSTRVIELTGGKQNPKFLFKWEPIPKQS